jgi:hypothetical protein
MIINFKEFLFESLNSSAYGVKEGWNGGFTLTVYDETFGSKSSRRESLIIPRKTEKAISLSYYRADGKLSEYFWIPNYAVKSKNYGGQSSRYQIEIPAYTKWYKEDSERSGLTNFLNTYIETMEASKESEMDALAEQAKDDVDMILDQIGIPDSVAEIEKTKDSYKFTGKTENGLYVEITKRTPDDLVGEFSIYPKDSDRPGFEYSYSSGQSKPNISFKVDGKKIDHYGYLTEIESSDFLNYLIKKAFGVSAKEDEERLVNYFQRICRELDTNYQYSDDPRTYKAGQEAYDHVKDVLDLVGSFMGKKEADELFNRCTGKSR